MLLDFIKEMLFESFPFTHKIIYSKRSFKNDIRISPRASEPVVFNLSDNTPSVDIYLTVENRSQYLDANLGRILFSLWVRDDKGFRSLIDQGYIYCHKIISKKSDADLYRHIILSGQKVDILRSCMRNKIARIDLNFSFDVRSKLYILEKKSAFQDIHCLIAG